MQDNCNEAEYWNHVAGRMAGRFHLDELSGEHKRNAHLSLLARWAAVTSNKTVLKTDLFEEALGPDHFLFHLAKLTSNVVGIDISSVIASRASIRSRQHGFNLGRYICCDVRQLPFNSDSFDLVISNSTLDHFSNEGDIIAALHELRRVLRSSGILIITMDNKGNLTEPFFRLWMLLGLGPFFVGKTYSIGQMRHVLESVGFRVEDATAIIHSPRFITVRTIRILHKLSARKFDPLIRKGLALLDMFEKRRTKYLTGLYVAVKAVKCEQYDQAIEVRER